MCVCVCACVCVCVCLCMCVLGYWGAARPAASLFAETEGSEGTGGRDVGKDQELECDYHHVFCPLSLSVCLSVFHSFPLPVSLALSGEPLCLMHSALISPFGDVCLLC